MVLFHIQVNSHYLIKTPEDFFKTDNNLTLQQFDTTNQRAQ